MTEDPGAPARGRDRPRLRLQLVGVPRLDLPDGRSVPLAGQGLLVAARLALAGPQPRATLAALLWPEATDSRARANLRQLLLRLKALAGAEWIQGDATLELAPALQVLSEPDGDGPALLDGVAAPGSPELAAWLDGVREQQRRERLRALSQRIADAESAGQLDDALAHARSRLALEPLSEEHHRALVRLHYLNHDRAQALAAYAHLQRMLADEFGATPDAESLALARLVDSARAAPPTGPSPAPAGRSRVPPALQRPPRLLGRAEPLAALCAQLRQPGCATLLAGEGGLGKTRLLAEALQALQLDGHGALTVGTRTGDAAVPYALGARVVQALLPLAADEDRSRLQPELAPVLPGAVSGPAPAARADVFPRLVAALRALLAAAAARGLRVLALDDMHLADAASVDLVGALFDGGPCALLLAFRPAEAGAALQALRQRLEARADTLALELRPLDPAAVAELLDTLAREGVAGIGGRAAQAQAQSLCRHTGGNPLYLLETLRAAREAGTRDGAAPWPRAPNVLRLIGQRLERLSPRALKVARCAAVAGADLSGALVARVLGAAPLDLAEAWAELDAAQILGARGFVHDLIAEAVHATLPPAVAEPLHAEVAAQLAAAQADPARVAEHWLAAREPLQAVPHLRAAAARAAALWRRREACQRLQHAATILQGADRPAEAFACLFDAADMAFDMGDVAFVQEIEPPLATLAGHTRQSDHATAAAYVRSWLLYHVGQQDEALELAQQALPQAGQGRARVEVLMLQHLSTMLWERRRVREALDAAERGLARIDAAAGSGGAADLGSLRLALSSLAGMAWCALSRYEHGCARIEQAWQIATHERELVEVSYATRLLAVIELFRGDLASADRWSRQAVEAMRAADQVHTTQEAYAAQARMLVATACGDLGDALQASERVIELHRLQPTGPVIVNAEERSVLMLELGRRDLARAAVPALDAGQSHTEVQRARRLAARAGLGLATAAQVEELLALTRGADDFNLQARLLWLAQPGVPAARIEPLLADATAHAAAHGGLGLWVMLQARRLAALRALKDPARAAEARAAALELWARIDQGTGGYDTFARTAAELCATLHTSDPALSEAVALRAGRWMLRAAATLPEAWRANYLERSAVLDLMPPRERALLRGLGVAAPVGAA